MNPKASGKTCVVFENESFLIYSFSFANRTAENIKQVLIDA